MQFKNNTRIFLMHNRVMKILVVSKIVPDILECAIDAAECIIMVQAILLSGAVPLMKILLTLWNV